MKRKALAIALSLALVLGTAAPALAAEGDLFPADAAMPAFRDVDPEGTGGSWYDYESVKVCVEAGLMKGADGAFNPGGPITIAEVAVIAARMYSHTAQTPIPEGKGWYQGHLELLKGYVEEMCAILNQENQGLADTGLFTPEELAALSFTPEGYCPALYKQPLSPATRLDFVQLLSLGAALGEPINDIKRLPDTEDPTVLSFYQAGIVTGIDLYGTFAGEKGLTRAEGASMVARIVRPSLRQDSVQGLPISFGFPIPQAPMSEAQKTWQEGHPIGLEEEGMLTLALALDRNTPLDGNEKEWLCYDLGQNRGSVLLSFGEKSTLTATYLLPFLCIQARILVEAIQREKGCSEDECWSAAFQPAGAAEPMDTGAYLKDFVKGSVARQLLYHQGNRTPSEEEVAAVRGRIEESPDFQALDVRALYELARDRYPSALYDADEWAELTGADYEK